MSWYWRTGRRTGRGLKTLVLDSVSSPITRRIYNLGLDEFIEGYGLEQRPGFTKATVSSWRVTLEVRGLGSVSVDVSITAVWKLAVEQCSEQFELAACRLRGEDAIRQNRPTPLDAAGTQLKSKDLIGERTIFSDIRAIVTAFSGRAFQQ
jgi:hypothetical protein